MQKKPYQGAMPRIGKYVNPLTDFGFKLLFGSEPHKELLISFLNELFNKRKHIVELTYNRNEHSGSQDDFRKSVYDLTCTGQDGEQFIIEVQRIRQPFFKDRAVYYTSGLIHSQAPKGRKWDYRLKEIYFIGLMDFCFEDARSGKYLHRVRLTEEGNEKAFYEKLRFIFIEIPRFSKGEKDLKTDLDRWMYLLKNMSKFQKIPVILSKRIFQKLFAIAAVSNLSKEEYMRYEKNLMAYWDEYAILQGAKEEGRAEEKISLIKNLLQDKFTISKIASLAGVSAAFVRKVKKMLK